MWTDCNGSKSTGNAWRAWSTALLVVGGVLSIASSALATYVLPLSLNETVRQAEAIVVGTVTERQSRWGDGSQRWMVTDYTFAVEDVIHASETNAIGKTIVLTYWGGTIDGETQSINDARLPVPGERLLVMLRPDWAKTVGFTPVVGFNHGLFSVMPDRNGGTDVRDAQGERLALAANGQVIRQAAGPSGLGTLSLAAFADWLRANIASIKAAPAEAPPTPNPSDPRLMALFAKSPSLTSSRVASVTQPGMRSPVAVHGAEEAAGVPNLPATKSSDTPTSAELIWSTDPGSLYVTKGKTPNLPIVVNNFPDSFTPWSPEDEYQMSKWNYYASDVFRVYTTPTSTYGYPDDVFDLAGFPSSADLQYVYGSGWDSNTLGVTFSRSNATTILEADIALNPAFDWTLDDEWVYDGSFAQSFRTVMIHELGHMHGLDHDFDALALMNYFPQLYTFFSMPFSDDAEGIRIEYPSRVVARTDLGVYLFHTTGFQDVDDADYPVSVVAGGSLTVNNYELENVGTATIATPTVEWYLTTARNFTSSYVYLGTSTYSSLARFSGFFPSSVSRTFSVPFGMAPGSYYLAAFIRNDEGAGQSGFPFSNNFAFSRTRIQVNPATRPTVTTNTATSVLQYSAVLNGTVNPNGTSTTTAFEYGTSTFYGSTVTAQSLTGTSAQAISAVASLACGTLYHFRARATNIAGTTYGSDLTLTTAACPPPAAFNKAAPASGATNQPPTVSLSWATSAGATGYQYCVDTTNNSLCDAAWVAAGAVTTAAIGNLAPSATYYWQVRALNAVGSTDANGGVWWSFTTQAFRAARLTQPSPSVRLPGQLVPFAWDQGFNVVQYSLFVGSAPGAGDIYAQNQPGLSAFVNNIPVDGRLIYVRLYSRIGNVWVYNDTAFLAALAQSATFDFGIVPMRGDYDGDGIADLVTWWGAPGVWHIVKSSTGYTQTLELAWGRAELGDRPIVGDFDGDGKADPAVWREGPGLWLIRLSTTNYVTSRTIQWGRVDLGDVPVPADFDGDGKTDPAVWRRGTGMWFALRSSTNYAQYIGVQWGREDLTDRPVPGDYDGDNKADPAVWRALTGEWFILRSSTNYTNYIAVSWGRENETDQPVPADYDGDGRTDIAVWRRANGVWYILKSSTNFVGQAAVQLGNAAHGDRPAQGRFVNGDLKVDPAVWRGSTGGWFFSPSPVP